MTSLVAAFLCDLIFWELPELFSRFFIFYISVSILVSCSVLLSTSVYPHMTYCEGDMCFNSYFPLLFNTVFCFVLIGKDRSEVSGFEAFGFLIFLFFLWLRVWSFLCVLSVIPSNVLFL